VKGGKKVKMTTRVSGRMTKVKMTTRVSGRMTDGVEEEAGMRVDSEKAFFGERQRVPVSSWFVNRHLELPLATNTHTHAHTHTHTHTHTHNTYTYVYTYIHTGS
jgi:hypothetical protein